MRRLTTVVFAVLALYSARARGDSSVVVLSKSHGVTELRVRAEIDALDLGTADAPDATGGETTVGAIERAARSTGARIVVRVLAGAAVEVWVRDPTTGMMALRDVVTADAETAADRDRTLALRVVEVLRVSLAERPRTRAPPSPPPPAVTSVPIATFTPVPIAVPRVPAAQAAVTPETNTTVPPPGMTIAPPPGRSSSWRLAVEAGPAVAFSAGGLGASMQGLAAIHVMPADHFGASVFASFPITPSRATAAEGTAEVQPAIFGTAARWEPSSDPALSPAFSAGLALVWLRTEGTSAASGFVASHDAAVTFGPFARAEIDVAIASFARLGAGLAAGATLRRVDVDFANRNVAGFGQPFALASLSVLFGRVSHGEPLPRQSIQSTKETP